MRKLEAEWCQRGTVGAEGQVRGALGHRWRRRLGGARRHPVDKMKREAARRRRRAEDMKAKVIEERCARACSCTKYPLDDMKMRIILPSRHYGWPAPHKGPTLGLGIRD